MQPEGPPDTYVKRCLARIVSHNHSGRRLNSQSACGYGEWPHMDSNPPAAKPFGLLEAPMGDPYAQRGVTGMVPGFDAEEFVSLTDYVFPRQTRDQWISALMMPNMYADDNSGDPAFSYLLRHQYRFEAPGYMANDELRQDFGGGTYPYGTFLGRNQGGSPRTIGASS